MDFVQSEKSKVILYANELILFHNSSYRARYKGFIDFLAKLAMKNSIYNFVVYCNKSHLKEIMNLPKIDVPEKIFKIKYHESENRFCRSFWNTINNLPFFINILRTSLKHCEKVILAGDGNSLMMMILTMVFRNKLFYAYFIRGDRAKNVRAEYSNHFIRRIYSTLISLPKKITFKMLLKEKAVIFTYGDHLLEDYTYYSDKVYSIAPLIDGKIIRKDRRPKIPNDRPLRVLFVGRFVEVKGIISLIDACYLSMRSGNPFSLSLIGEGKLEDAIRKRVYSKGLSDWVNTIGFVPFGDKLIEFYDSHDLVCLPSKSEGMPRVVAEAFARSMPVLATRVGGLPHRFEDIISFIDGFDCDSVLEGIQWCDKNRDTLSEMGHKGLLNSDYFVINRNVNFVDGVIRSYLR